MLSRFAVRWDATTYKYKVAEPAAPSSITELETYAFVFRVRICELMRRMYNNTEVLTTPGVKQDEQRISYVDVHAPGLRNMLHEVLKDVHWLSLKDDPLVVSSIARTVYSADMHDQLEQNLLYHYLPTLQTYLDAATHHKTWPQSDCDALQYLLSTMRTRTADMAARCKALLQVGKITYELLWTLFPPNTLVLTMCPGSVQVRCLRFQLAQKGKTSQGVEYLALQCEHIDYDGILLGGVLEDLRIQRFQGAVDITTLPTYPVSHYADTRIHGVLKDRGQRFIRLQGSHHRSYNGTAFLRVKDGYERRTIRGEIMVDADQFSKANPGYARLVTRYVDPDSMFGDEFTQSRRVMDRRLDSSTLTDDELMLCPATVLAYSLEHKFWGEFVIKHIHPLQWSSNSLAGLAIPASTKNILLSVTRPYFPASTSSAPPMRGTRIMLQ